MKKLFKLFILICVCFIPVMVDAKTNFEFKDDYYDMIFLKEDNGEYFYLDLTKDYYDTDNVVVYSKNGKFLRRDDFFEEDVGSYSTPFTSSKYFDSYYELYLKNNNSVYDEEDGILYNIYYYSERITYRDSKGVYTRKDFNENLEFTKRILGKKYDAFLKVKSSNVEVDSVIESNGYFVVYYYNYNDDVYYASVLDKNLKTVRTFDSNTYEDIFCLYVYDDLVYLMTSPTTIEVYKLDGSLFETLTISHEALNNSDGGSYDTLFPYVLYIKNNELFIMYNCYRRSVKSETNDLSNNDEIVDYLRSLTLVYSLNYAVNKVEPSNGDFTYTRKFDDEGREYVELKITPQKGYTVEDIIVTDIEGRRIDVTNNKFYMPASDVNVEVKFGEYIPIPDTFSNMSPVIIFISVILIGCGMCVIGHSLKHKKA